MVSCKKNAFTDTKNNVLLTDLNYKVTGDTNYIPHANSNVYTYGNHLSPFVCTVKNYLKTSSKISFEMEYVTDKKIFAADKYEIDSSGKYQALVHTFSNKTYENLIVIDPKANNGDTIFNDPVKKIFTILIEKNFTLKYNDREHPNCYYTKTSYPDGGNEVCFYKKGVGLLFWGGFALTSNTSE
ncbi:MAG: hypothetical protein ACK50A_00660 [Sphingobacteriaceae bacterium]